MANYDVNGILRNICSREIWRLKNEIYLLFNGRKRSQLADKIMPMYLRSLNEIFKFSSNSKSNMLDSPKSSDTRPNTKLTYLLHGVSYDARHVV